MSAPEVELLDTEIDADLRATVRSFLSERCDPGDVVKAYDGDSSLTPVLWKGLAADLGLAGLLIPESYGGAGASAREAAVVLEELGRSVAPVPFLTSAVVATSVLLAGPTEKGVELLGGMAAGERTAALVVPLSTTTVEPMAPVEVEVRSVAGALEAEVGHPGLFSFEPGRGAVQRLAEGIDRLLSLRAGEREELRRTVSSFVANHWTWERTAAGLLSAAGSVR
jgi:hypothetical protein